MDGAPGQLAGAVLRVTVVPRPRTLGAVATLAKLALGLSTWPTRRDLHPTEAAGVGQGLLGQGQGWWCGWSRGFGRVQFQEAPYGHVYGPWSAVRGARQLDRAGLFDEP